VVATMDRPERFAHLDLSESTLYSASTLLLHGLPFDYDALRSVVPPDMCPICSTALTNPLRVDPLHERLFSWQTHMGRCGGDGRRTHVHEVVKLAVKRLVLCNPDPGGVAIPSNQLILEARHLHSDASRPGDLYALVGGLHAKDVSMDVVLNTALSKSCLLHTGFCYKAGREQQVHEGLAQQRAPSSLSDAALHSAGDEPMWPQRTTLRGYSPGARVYHDQSPLRLPSAPRPVSSPSDSCFGESPCRMGSALDLDNTTRICSSNNQSSIDTQGCNRLFIVQCSPREGESIRGCRPGWSSRTGPCGLDTTF